jgi:hypothetical protein
MYKLQLQHSYSNKELEELFITKKLLDEIEEFKYSGYLRMPMIKKELNNIFGDNNFIMKQKIHPNSNIFISGIQKEIGLCIQLGYKNNWYYDMCKLSLLHNTNRIQKAIIILPSKNLENFCKTSNVATYELIIDRNKIFSDLFKIKPYFFKLEILGR